MLRPEYTEEKRVGKRKRKKAKQTREWYVRTKYYESHKAEVKQRADKHARKPKARYTRLLYVSTKLKDYGCTLTFEEYAELIKRPCFYCGGGLSPVGHGLDRIKSEKGYDADNVRPCCKRCNLAKNDMSEEEFKAWILRVLNHWVTQESLKETDQQAALNLSGWGHR